MQNNPTTYRCYNCKCYKQNFSYGEALTPTVVCEDETIRRQSRLDEVVRVGPWSNRIGVLINEGETPELSPLLSAFVQRKALVRTTGRLPSASQEVSPRQKLSQSEP